MKAQACKFKRKKDSLGWETGIAVLNIGFDCSDVKFIIDNDGKKVPKTLWNYRLISRPMSYLDTDYEG